jgi:hypothetical protein
MQIMEEGGLQNSEAVLQEGKINSQPEEPSQLTPNSHQPTE